jgi:hypothetical protein
MKATKAKEFQPITLTIETQAELDYLIALAQSSVAHAASNARDLGFELSHEARLVQMPLYNTLKEMRDV